MDTQGYEQASSSAADRYTAPARLGATILMALLLVAGAVPAAANELSGRIQDLLENSTDGTVGLYLKRVDGAVLANFNELFVTYPSSSIKVVQHLHAMRAVEAGLDLDATMLISCHDCSSCSACSPGCQAPPPNCMAGVNCSDNPDAGSGCSTTALSLRCALERMMLISSNQAANSVQELFGNGTPSIGRDAMNQTSWNVVGMSMNTALYHKFACGNVSNNPFNTMTLVDMGLLYEKAATDPNVLMNPTQLYQLMLNETNGGLINAIGNVADAEAVNLGMLASDADVQAFKGAIRLAYKAGNIPFDNAGNDLFQSLAGWVEVPFECDQPDEQYVYGYFIDNATQTSGSGSVVISELLRDQLAAALGTVLCERPPQVHAPAPLTVECNALGGMAANDPQIVNWLGQASATDACDVVTVSDDAPGFFPADCPPGSEITTVTFQSSLDSCGEGAGASSTVTVQDTTAPVLQGVPADETVECDAVPPPAVVTASDVCSGPRPVDFEEQKINGDCPGNYALTRTWSAVDLCGVEASESQVLTVEDTTPPTVQSGAQDLYCLWPPNHKYVCFGKEQFTPMIEDNCSEPISWQFAGCSSDEPDDVPGSGNTTNDCVVADDGGSFCVRAERQGGANDGRRYAVAISATDACGNSSDPVVIGYIHVPHNGGATADCLGS